MNDPALIVGSLHGDLPAASRSMLFDTHTPETPQQVESLMADTLASVRNLLGMEVAFISEFDEGRRVFRYIDANQGFQPIEVGDSDPLNESYCQRVVDGRLPELMPDATKNAEALRLAATLAIPIGAHLSVPIRFSTGRVFGTFCCFSREADNTLGNRDLDTMKLFASFIANILEERDNSLQDKRVTAQRLRYTIDEHQYSSAFQPIFDITSGKTVGFEALSRFPTEPRRSPDVWVADATSVGLEKELEVALLKNALNSLQDIPEHAYLSLNVTPSTILNGQLDSVLQGHPLDRLVLEITEHQAIGDYEKIDMALAALREQGLRLAVDDAGAGYASFRHILKLKPDIIKLDISLIKNIDSDIACKTLASALVNFAKVTGSQVIAEGVETVAELKTLRELGISRVQGFLLGRPKALGEYKGKWPERAQASTAV